MISPIRVYYIKGRVGKVSQRSRFRFSKILASPNPKSPDNLNRYILVDILWSTPYSHRERESAIGDFSLQKVPKWGLPNFSHKILFHTEKYRDINSQAEYFVIIIQPLLYVIIIIHL